MNKYLIVISIAIILLGVGLNIYIENIKNEKDVSEIILGVWEFEQMGIIQEFHFLEDGDLKLIS
jgi:hypothetical protein